MNTYAIDYETYYNREYSLKKMPVEQYVNDERFDPYLVALEGPDVSYVGHPSMAPWEKIRNQRWVSHNAAFDRQVHYRAIEIGIIPGEELPKDWNCTMDLVAYLQASKSLQKAAKQLLNIKVDKEVRKRMESKDYQTLNDEERADWHEYAKQDSVICLKLWNEFSDRWPEDERFLSNHTIETGMRGVGIDQDLIEQGQELLRLKIQEAKEQIPWSTDKDKKLLSPKALRLECEKEGIPPPTRTAEDSEECQQWEKEYGERFPWIAAMRTVRKANKSLKTLETIQNRTRQDSTMPFAMKYFGAAGTARWSGASGLNIQNLPRGDVYGVDIRGAFVPRPGKKFVIADFSAIEPRVLAYLINDQAFLDQVRDGKDVYEAHARSTMGYDDPRALKEANPQLRQLAKARVLGASYGASGARFVKIAKDMAGLELSLQEANQAIQRFRYSNPKLTRLWRALDCNFKKSYRDKAFELELPSNRIIRYFNVAFAGGWRAQITRGGNHYFFWGAKLCENLVQATARDVFAQSIINLEKAGFPVIFHVHDEVIVEIDKGDNDGLNEICQIMEQSPDWLEGCPLSVEATTNWRYTK